MVEAVEVVVAAEEVDLASGLLWGAGVAAVAEHPIEGGRVRLRADVPPGGVAAVAEVLGGRWPVEAVDLADDGLDAWRAHARVVRAGRHLVVHPPWLPAGPVGPDDVVLAIDPGRAFGHGAHPTTRLCLAALEDLVGPGSAVLDVGCGSGVLAVAAARLGAGRVVAVDVEVAAVEATRANAAANGVEVDASLDALAAVDGSYDVVVANIGAAALRALAPDLVARLAGGGTLVLSGLLDPPPLDLAARYGPLGLRATRTEDGWSALLLSGGAAAPR